MATIKDLKELLKKYNLDAILSNGNSTGYSSKDSVADLWTGNIDCDNISIMDNQQIKCLKKVKRVVLWASE
jgi:hypothetical protein